MTLIKGMRLSTSPPQRNHHKNAELDISIGLRTHNYINQGNRVKN